MKELAYIIEPLQPGLTITVATTESKGHCLTVPDKSRLLSESEINKIASPLDKPVLAFLKENPSPISPRQSLHALKLLAATGRLYFNGKQLVADVYGTAPIAFYVDKSDDHVSVTKKVKLRDQEVSLDDCDYIGQGPPHWLIKGISLKIIGSDITWSDLKKSAFTLEEIKELVEAHRENPSEPPVIFLNHADERVKQKSDPLPLLILKDKTGAFADLWMNYGNEKKLLFHPQMDAAAKSWEKDLLETDFIPKRMENSHYYCPLNKVSKSLLFLLEIGWNIQDWRGNKILRQTDMQLSLENEAEALAVRGKINFSEFQADLSAVAGAFNRRERFVQIGVGAVGLIPDGWEKAGFNGLLEEAEIVSDKLTVKKHAFGMLAELFPVDKHLPKEFRPVSHCAPGSAFKGELRPYQQEGCNWLAFLHNCGFNGILADDMGLGKTVQVLAFLSQLELQKPVLIVMPTSLIFNWHREILRFLPNQPVVVHHGPGRAELPDTGIVLTTYTTLRLDLPLFNGRHFACILLDEAQAIKNAHTQTSQSVCSLRADFKLCITGTPIENHLGELWSHFRFLMPDLLGNEQTFLADLQTGSSDGRYYQRIKKKIRPFILRRKKEEVAKDLPDCIEQVVYVEMPQEQRQVYENYLAGIKGNLIKKVEIDGMAKHRMEIFEAILRLRQICCHPLLVSDTAPSGKLESLLEDIQTAMSEGVKILVYSQFTSMLSLIAKAVKERGWKHLYLDGSTKNREQVVAQFQEDPQLQLFLISLKAGGVGLNLTAADYVFIYDPWWNNAVEEQAIGRAHRIGRKDTVIAKKYISIESIEEKIQKLKDNKKALITDILDEDFGSSTITEDDLKFLLT